MITENKSWITDNIKAVLAIIVVVLGISYFYMCSIREIKPDPQILIAMVSSIGVCLGYYFGSSQSSSKKDDTLTTIATQPTVQQTGSSPQVTVNSPSTDTQV